MANTQTAKKQAIEVQQTIRASREKIFPYLTDQDKLVQWFPTRAETDPVVGGHYMLAFEFSDPAIAEKGNHTREGKYKKVDAPRALEYSWEVGDTDVSFELEGDDKNTTVKIVHSGWEDQGEAYQQHTQGWTFFLSNLKTLIEDNNDRRADEMWLKEPHS
jgi:uncharacterized protein YndB with AHSA1/START domain